MVFRVARLDNGVRSMGARQALRSGATPVLGTVIPLLALGFAPNASAQVFCPGAVGAANPGIVLNGSFCTNGSIGALSTAALSSQSLSEVTEATTQQSTTTTFQALERRRNEERTRDTTPARTSSRRSSQSDEPSRTTRTSSPGSSQSTMTEPSRGVRREARETVRREPPLLYKAPPMIYEPVRYAVWGQGFGEFERRTGSGVVPPPQLGLGGLGLGGTPINMSQSATIWGFNGGADATFRNTWWGGDILIAGLLTGYMSSDIRYSTGTLTGSVEGPSLGGYVTYLSGRWTTELLGRVDFLRLSETFNETLAFNNGASVPISGSASTGLNDYIAAGNFYYKIIDAYTWWLEPTAGFRFTQSSYDASAAALGLASGHAWRVQGGMRLAGNYFWGGVLVTPSITGLAYDDVDVTGQVVTGGQFNAAPIIPLDQGKVRGQGILALNFDYGTGVSAYVSGEVHGGSNLFGAGGKAGIRYQW
jgi:hypothetical protein